MLIVALVLAVIGLAALVTAVVTSNELIAWVCIGASVIGVLLLIVDALRERSRRDENEDGDDDESVVSGDEAEAAEDYPDDPTSQLDAIPADDVTAANALTDDSHDDDSGTAKG
jgi:membrane protein implicated in regulation of membrane protease activity